MSDNRPFPRFMDIEFCQTDAGPVPVAMAWSLADGRMKTVVIEPDDSWLEDDGEGLTERGYLREQGVPVIELCQALHEDLPDQTVYVDGLDPDEELVERLFSAVGMDAPFEVARLAELLPEHDPAMLEDSRSHLMFEHGLEPQLPENGVYALLLLAQQEGLIPMTTQPDDEF